MCNTEKPTQPFSSSDFAAEAALVIPFDLHKSYAMPGEKATQVDPEDLRSLEEYHAQTLLRERHQPIPSPRNSFDGQETKQPGEDVTELYPGDAEAIAILKARENKLSQITSEVVLYLGKF